MMVAVVAFVMVMRPARAETAGGASVLMSSA